MAQRLKALAALVEDQDFTLSTEYVNSQPSATPVAGDPASSSDFHTDTGHIQSTGTYVQTTHTHTHNLKKTQNSEVFEKKKSIVDVFEVSVSVFFFIKKS